MCHLVFLKHFTNIVISMPILGVSSNPDFYSQLTDQFESESYGDLLFSLFLALPLVMKQPTSFRKMFWTEKSECGKLI